MNGTEIATAKTRRRSPFWIHLTRIAIIARRQQRRTQAMMKMITPAFVLEVIVPSVLVESLLSTPPTMQRMRAISVRTVRRWNISEWKA